MVSIRFTYWALVLFRQYPTPFILLLIGCKACLDCPFTSTHNFRFVTRHWVSLPFQESCVDYLYKTRLSVRVWILPRLANALNAIKYTYGMFSFKPWEHLTLLGSILLLCATGTKLPQYYSGTDWNCFSLEQGSIEYCLC